MRKALVLAMVLAGPVLASEDPASAVSGFYDVYAPVHAGGIPDATARARLASVLSPHLNALLADAARSQARLSAKMKRAVPPLLEGDVFSSLFEGASDWKIGECRGDAKLARCPVVLNYAPPPKASARPARWTDTVVVVATPSGWKVDDVIYDPGFTSGNTGKLSDMLGMVIAQNP